ncbi:hypothetical protein GOV04_01430 [Candidatus Woesearchaeota archaeon]|nr:hypothetical protein [Candidatus Woesearchaeota archaeon]
MTRKKTTLSEEINILGEELSQIKELEDLIGVDDDLLRAQFKADTSAGRLLKKMEHNIILIQEQLNLKKEGADLNHGVLQEAHQSIRYWMNKLTDLRDKMQMRQKMERSFTDHFLSLLDQAEELMKEAFEHLEDS